MSESLHEISTKLKKAYISKATQDVADKSHDAGYKLGDERKGSDIGTAERKKVVKRVRGINRALGSMKESTHRKGKVLKSVKKLLNTEEAELTETEMRDRDAEGAQARRVARAKKWEKDPNRKEYTPDSSTNHLDGRTKEFDKAVGGKPHTQRYNHGKHHTDADHRNFAKGTHVPVKNSDGTVTAKKTEKYYELSRKRHEAKLAAKGIQIKKKVAEDMELNEYNKDAVDASIASSNRAGRKIGKKEAKRIHALLKGWRGDSEQTTPKKTTKEEVEVLDELKKSTIASYIKKAEKEQGDAAYDWKYGKGDKDEAEHRMYKRDDKIAKARKKLASMKESEELQELSKGTLVSYIQQSAIDAASASRYSKDDPKMKKKVTKRLRGIAKASQKLEK